MTPDPPSAADRSADAIRLWRESLAADDPTGWFERLYAAAADGDALVPWDRGEPHPLLVEWARRHGPETVGPRTLVVGSGLGEDAAFLARLGFRVVAFDISTSAISAARRRFPAVPVDFRVANLLEPPPEWAARFDLVLECYTIQSLPIRLRPTVVAHVSRFVAPGGTLLVLATAREEGEIVDGPPWPLSRSEIELFAAHDLEPALVEEIREPPHNHHWRARFVRAG